MRIQQAGAHATLVLLNAGANAIRLRDAVQIREYLRKLKTTALQAKRLA